MTFNEVYIQKDSDDYAAVGLSDWSIYAVELPYIPMPNLKDPYSNDWYDEDGDDEYIPTTPHYKSIELKLKLACKTELGITSVTDSIRNCIKYMANQGEFRIYLNYGDGCGWQKCRYVGYDTEAKHFKQAIANSNATEDVVVFEVSVKVNDPITEMKLIQESSFGHTYYKIVENTAASPTNESSPSSGENQGTATNEGGTAAEREDGDLGGT